MKKAVWFGLQAHGVISMENKNIQSFTEVGKIIPWEGFNMPFIKVLICNAGMVFKAHI